MEGHALQTKKTRTAPGSGFSLPGAKEPAQLFEFNV